jgi:chromosome segregation ATPase
VFAGQGIMAERATRKVKRSAPPRRTEGIGATSAERTAQRIKSLERERDRLKSQLAEAEARIARLEESRAEAVNRIDWVIDSLHNVLENGA